MNKIVKKITGVLCAAFLLVESVPIYGAPTDSIIYENVISKNIAPGVTYVMDRNFTQEGWLDIHVLKIDPKNPYISLEVLDSQDSYGSKKTLTQLMGENDAVAGINGDFFTTSNDPTDTVGLVVEDGTIESVYNDMNQSRNWLSSLIVDKNGDASLDFFKIHFQFANSDQAWINIGAVNKITDFSVPIFLDDTIGGNTSSIDASFPNLMKIVVEDNKIKYISSLGESVEIPADGYVITIPQVIADNVLKSFSVGQDVEFQQNVSMDVSEIQTAMSGGGLILKDGQILEEGLVVEGSRRHPRTAMGVTKDNKIILMVVDGRGSSIGATHQEMAAYLLKYGATDAMHLDGGGSSTLAGRIAGESSIGVLNQPSGGTQRRIGNGLGVISNAPQGKLETIELQVDSNRAFTNSPIEFTIVGYDEYYNPVEIDPADIVWQTNGIHGKWNDNKFYPFMEGEGTVTATVKGVSASTAILCMGEPKGLQISPTMIYVDELNSTPIELMGLNKEGYSAPVDSSTIQWSVEPSYLGKIEDSNFVAGNQAGVGELIGKIGDTIVKGIVVVGSNKVLVESLDDPNVTTTAYPDSVKSSYTIEKRNTKKGNAVKLKYFFAGDTDATQGAYIQFTNPIKIPNDPKKIGAWVYGDGSEHWLRGRVTDETGTQYNITFSYEIDWTGWKYVEAELPAGIQGLVSLDRIYVVTLRNENPTTNEIIVDEIQGVYSLEVNKELPEQKMADYLNQGISTDYDSEKTLDVTVFGATSGKNRLLDQIVERNVLEKMQENSDLCLFTGGTDIDGNSMGNPVLSWNDTYQVADYDDLRVFSLATSKKSLRLSQPGQWTRFLSDLNATKQDHIIILTKENPLVDFTDPLEKDLFQQKLSEFREATGKSIFVVSSDGYSTNTELKDGIRYIHLNGLWYTINNQSVNLQDTFYILRFQIDGKNLTYDVQPVYPKVFIK